MAKQAPPGLFKRAMHGWRVGLAQRDGYVLIATLILASEIFLILHGVPRL